MRKLITPFLLLALSLSLVQAAYAQNTRPRRVGSRPTPQTTTPQTSSPVLGEEPPPPPATSERRPPVLGGANNTGTRTSDSSIASAQTPDKDEPVELGEGDTLRISTTLVTVPVSVLDRNGKYVPNLRKEDFRIYEEGQEQQVAYFASVEQPFTVALVIDTSGSTLSKLEEIHEAAINFVNQLRPDDTVTVISFSDRVRVLCEPTTDRYTIQSAIRRAQPGEGTKLYDAVDFVINERLNRIKGRKALVLFTDGVDTTSRRATFESTTRDAEELDALIYPILFDTYADTVARMGGGGGRGGNVSIGDVLAAILTGRNVVVTGGGGGGSVNCRGCTREEYDRGEEYLRELATRTGTRVEMAGDGRNLSQAFSIIAEELRRQYSIGYYPSSQAQAGQRRGISVRVNRPNMAVRARSSYITKDQQTQDSYQNDQQQPQLKSRQTATTQPK
ncbi:MAG TPA: VWA domain-containing protein [Pyrinomonadaceae bacterium]|nr:VWA domain-containing protein [Pyrinomonadaceae bacterium]